MVKIAKFARDNVKRKPGMKFAVIGMGQAGGKIANAFASIKENLKKQTNLYTCIAINTNNGDMLSLHHIPTENKLLLEGYENGAGKNRETGKRALAENGEAVFERVSALISDCDVVIIPVAVGGGTGSGGIALMAQAIATQLEKEVIVIAAIPRPHEIESLNAFGALSELTALLDEHYERENGEVARVLESLIILDNEQIWQEHSEDPETNQTWDIYSNEKVSTTLHEWNILTSMGSEMFLDSSDFKNHILKRGGCVTYSKKRIEVTNSLNETNLLAEALTSYKERNVLANGFDYENDLISMAVVMLVPETVDFVNVDTLEHLRTKYEVSLPNATIYPGLVKSSDVDAVYIYTCAALGGLPLRAKHLRDEALELKRKREEKEKSRSGFGLGTIESENNTLIAKKAIKTKNPFASVLTKKDNTEIKGTIGNKPIKKPGVGNLFNTEY